MRKVLFIAALLTAAGFLSGCKHKNEQPTVAPAARVGVIVVGDTLVSASQTFPATVASASSTTVSFSVAGTIEQLYVEEGDKVSEGRLLGKIKNGDYVNANNITQAELAEAEDAYQRLKKLHDANALPEIKWVEIGEKVKQARNAAEISARALKETSLYSPMSGVISRKFADRGQNVAPVEPIFEIVTTDALTADISVPESEVDIFNVGQSVEVNFNIDGVGTVPGKVIRKAVVADPLTRSYKVEIAIPSGAGKILPGMVANVMSSPSAKVSENMAVELPSQAVVLTNDNRHAVWVVSEGRVSQRFVEVDEMTASGITVTLGLHKGDTVVVEGMQKIGSGSIVDAILRTGSK